MPTRQVTIIGLMTWDDSSEPPKPPLGIWGPTDPRPTFPIAGWDPIHGTFPPFNPPPVSRPPWRPEVPGSPAWGQPHPDHPISGIPGISLPIFLPGMPGWGEWPPKPPTEQPPGMAGQLPASDPSGSGWVFGFVPGYGWMWAFVPAKPPVTEPPPTEGGGPEVPEPKQMDQGFPS